MFEYSAKTQCGIHDRAVVREVGGEKNSPGFCQKAWECKGFSFLVDGVLCEHNWIG